LFYKSISLLHNFKQEKNASLADLSQWRHLASLGMKGLNQILDSKLKFLDSKLDLLDSKLDFKKLETRFIGLETLNPGLETRILGLYTRYSAISDTPKYSVGL